MHHRKNFKSYRLPARKLLMCMKNCTKYIIIVSVIITLISCVQYFFENSHGLYVHVNDKHSALISSQRTTSNNFFAPNVVLLGPHKSGTSSFGYSLNLFSNIEYYGTEGSYWEKNCKNNDMMHQLTLLFLQNKTDFKLTDKKNAPFSQIKQMQKCNLNYFLSEWKQRANIEVLKHFENQFPMTCSIDFNFTHWNNKSLDYSNDEFYKDQTLLLNNIKNSIYASNKDDAIKALIGNTNISLYNNSNGDINTIIIDTLNQSVDQIDVRSTQLTMENSNFPHCILFEKYINLVWSPETALIFSNYFAQMKVFIVVRNPTERLQSILNFGGIQKTMFEMYQSSPMYENNCQKYNLTRYQCIFKTRYSNNNTADYKNHHQIDKQCLIFSQQLDLLNSNNGENDVKHFQIYHNFVAEMLCQIYLSNKKVTRLVAFIIFWTYIYDEKFGFKNWNQLKLIQFDWIFNDLSLSIGIVNCWIQLNLDSTVLNQFSDISDIKMYQQCKRAYFENKKYFNSANQLLIQQQNVKRFHADYDLKKDQFTQDDKRKFTNHVFYSCNKALYSILRTRMDQLLLGQWLPWEYVDLTV